MSLTEWIYRESRRRACEIKDDIARRLLMEAENLSDLTEYEAKERLGILLDSMRVTGAVSRRDAKPRGSWASPRPQAMWEDARRVWENDPREGWAWLKHELALPVSKPAIRKRALADGWEKQTGCRPVPPPSDTIRAGQIREGA